MNLKFKNSKLYEANKILNKKPFKYIYKELMPKKLYKKIQKNIDFRQQEAVSKSWRKFINEYNNGNLEKFEFKKKKEIKNKKIIWQYWGTGWDFKELPDIVKLCYNYIEKYKGEYEVIRLDDNNISEYINFPEFVEEKRKEKGFQYAFFSDLLRLALLDTYGGIWLDATILLTDKIPKKLEEKDYFLFQRSENSENKKEWEKHNNDYFSWDKRNRIKVLNSIIFAKKGNKVINICLNILMNFWKLENEIPHYFFFQILYNELIENELKEYKCEIIDDTFPHLLINEWNNKFEKEKLKKIKDKTNIHKLTHKLIYNKDCKKDSFYEYFLKEKGLNEK